MSSDLVNPLVKSTGPASENQFWFSYSTIGTPNRRLNTWYQNTEKKPIFVGICFQGRENEVQTKAVLTSPDPIIFLHGDTTSGYAQDINVTVFVSFYIPAGHWYLANNSTGIYKRWTELREVRS